MTNFHTDKTYALFQTPGNQKLIAKLKKQSAKVFVFPPLETVSISLGENQRKITENLARFDWIIFADVFAVEYFLRILEENAIDLYELDNLRVCALGEAVSDRLRFAQLHADVIPTLIETETIFRTLVEYLGGKSLNELSFLFPKENSINCDLTEKLKKAGAFVLELPIYKINLFSGKEFTKLKILLENGAIDEFIFSSAEDVLALRRYFSDEVENVRREVKTSAIGEAAFQTLREYGFKPRVFPSQKEN